MTPAAPPRGQRAAMRDAPRAAGAVPAICRALTYLRAHVRDAAGALLALLLVSAATLVVPQLIRLAVDRGVAQRDGRTLALAAAGLVGVAVLRGLFAFAQGYLAERASQGVAFDVRGALFAHLERLSFGYYDRAETGQLLTRLTSDVEQVRAFVGGGVVQLVAAAVLFVGTAALLLATNAALAAVVLLTVVPIALLLAHFVRSVGPRFRDVQQALGSVNATLQEDIAGVRVVRAFGREEYEDARYRAANEDLLARTIATVRAQSNNFPFVALFASLGTVAVVWVGGRDVIAGRLTIGGLLAFNSYLAFLVQPLLTIGFLVASLTRAGASAARIFEVLDAPLDVRDAPDAVALPPIRGAVEFRDVCFRYPGTDRNVLHEVSFRAEPGQTVALLGETGSGKSTLVNVIPRFYDVTAGAVLVDGYDVRDVTLESLRRQVGVVLQDARLFSGTVRDNIAYGRPDATPAEVEAAARAAQADAFVRELPDGYDTVVGERGVGLSGGQRQRIAIARALLVRPGLLILDDSTSAVDAETEAAIRASLDALLHDRAASGTGARAVTTFVVAQRVSSVRDADVILVLEGGRIVARGTHEELLRESEAYHRILGSQLAGVAVLGEPEMDDDDEGGGDDGDGFAVAAGLHAVRAGAG